MKKIRRYTCTNERLDAAHIGLPSSLKELPAWYIIPIVFDEELCQTITEWCNSQNLEWSWCNEDGPCQFLHIDPTYEEATKKFTVVLVDKTGKPLTDKNGSIKTVIKKEKIDPNFLFGEGIISIGFTNLEHFLKFQLSWL